MGANIKVTFGISEFQKRTIIAAQHYELNLFAPEPELACLGLQMMCSSKTHARPMCCRALPERQQSNVIKSA